MLKQKFRYNRRNGGYHIYYTLGCFLSNIYLHIGEPDIKTSNVLNIYTDGDE